MTSTRDGHGPGQGPGRGRGILAGLVVGLALLGCDQGGAQSGNGDDVDVPEISGERAHALLVRQVDFGPRVPGSAGHRAQLEWMLAYLRERADTVETQAFTHTTATGVRLDLTNVFARFRPEAEDRVLLVAHWDTRPTADNDPDPAARGEPIAGANDGASGTALLLELADVLSRHSPPIGVDILLVDGEDYAQGEMYLGATYFAANKPPGYRPLYGVLVDMIADHDPRFPVEGYSQQYAPEVVDRVWRTAERIGYGALFPRTEGLPIQDDHVPLNQAGIRTVNIIDFDYPYWHTSQDVVEHTAPRGLQAVGEVLLRLIYTGG